jgi:molecular chaperone DnaK
MRAIGIDLGTTNSAAAIHGSPPLVLPTRHNEQLTPSVVSCYVSRSKPGEGQLYVGRPAANNAARDPANTLFSVKRLMGRVYGETLTVYDGQMTLDDLQRRFGYRFAPAPPPDAEDHGLRVLLGNTPYTPTQVSAMILRQVKEDAQLALGEPVTHAVITVPAYFNERQRAATKAAGVEAGLEVLEIIDEPTAAALAYGLGRESERRCVLVFDLGGGTFDISVIQMTGGKYVQRTIQGNNWLGGDDFDLTIVRRILAAARAEYGDLSGDPMFVGRAKEEAEKAKRALTSQDQVEVNLIGVKTENLGPVEVQHDVTRPEFESDIAPMVKEAMNLVTKALAVVPQDQITDVLLVGGSTAVPLVQKAVIERFGAERVRRTINPMECVALGAGFKASGYQLAGGRAEPAAGGPRVSQVTPMHLGIAVVEGTNTDRFETIIPKGTPYPLPQPKTKVFHPTKEHQTLIRIPVYEGMNELASLNELQGEVLFHLPQGVATSSPVEVSFDYNRDRLLTIRVRVVGTEQFVEKELQHGRTPGRAAGADRLIDDWREELDPLVRAGKYFQKTYGEYMTEADGKDLATALAAGDKALEQNSPVDGHKAMNTLRHKIFYGSGVASQLFLAERSIASQGVSPPLTAQLRDKTAQLRSAYKEKKWTEVDRYSEELRLIVAQVIQQHATGRRVDDIDLKDMLKVMS